MKSNKQTNKPTKKQINKQTKKNNENFLYVIKETQSCGYTLYIIYKDRV